MQHIVYKNNIDKDIDIKKLYNSLSEKGYVKFNIGEITKEEFLTFSYNFGEVIPSGRGREMIDDILINDGTGTEKLPFHTDKSYWRIPPRFEILYVKDMKNMEKGEISVSSIIGAYNCLNMNEKEILINYSSPYKNPTNRDSGLNPNAKFIGIIDGNLEFFRYRLDIFDSNVKEINKLKKIIEDEKNIKYIKYEKGDILILDNWQYAAGRNITEWGENGFRHLYRTLVI